MNLIGILRMLIFFYWRVRLVRREAPREQELQLGAGIFIVWQVGGIQLIMKNLHHTLLVYAGFILKINVTIAGQMGNTRVGVFISCMASHYY